MLSRLVEDFLAKALIATLLSIPLAAEASLYKCKDSSGAVTYKDAPCVQSEQQQLTDRSTASPTRSATAMPKQNEPGLWERAIVLHPRASHPKEVPQLSREELAKAGDYKFYLGVPMKTQECTTRSPIEVMLPKWAYQCDHQIKARGGVCEASQNNLGSGHESFETISGDYRSELHVKSRVMQGKDANGKQVYDEAETHIRYLGPCKADMKSGDTFLVGEDGRLTKQR